jgi:hypothetical protein
MYTLSYTIPVNPEGVEPRITKEQVWRGLEMKAENAIPFVNGMTQCDMLERTDNTITRIVTFRGGQHKEFLTLFPPVKVQFARMDGTGWIDNTISESDDGLLLTFTFAITFPGIEENTDAEKEHGDSMRGAYLGAVGATLDRVRQMVADGEL